MLRQNQRYLKAQFRYNPSINGSAPFKAMSDQIKTQDLLYALAILLAFIFFGSGLIVGITEVIWRFVRDFSLDLVSHVFYALILWLGAAGLAVVLFVSVGHIIRRHRR
jgi:Na+-transporting NADH:ubiquinone oxidoreductase subunit NqrB